MSCPAHIAIYKAQKRSYREIPMRLMEFGIVHRNEPSGTISKKIRELSARRVPLIAIVGDREAANGTVNLRRLGVPGQEEIFLAQLEEELSYHQNQLAVAS